MVTSEEAFEGVFEFSVQEMSKDLTQNSKNIVLKPEQEASIRVVCKIMFCASYIQNKLATKISDPVTKIFLLDASHGNKERKLICAFRLHYLSTILYIQYCAKVMGSISVSGKLRTYPSPNPAVTLTYLLIIKCRVRGGVGAQFPRN